MVKGIVSILLSLLVIAGGTWIEQRSIRKDFSNFDVILHTLEDKMEMQNVKGEDVLAVQKWWIQKKSKLHAYIPHNEIKDIDHWLAESVSLVQTGDYDLALSKIEVLRELCEHIPGTFRITFENIF